MSNCMERHILAVRQAMQFWGQSAGQQTHRVNIGGYVHSTDQAQFALLGHQTPSTETLSLMIRKSCIQRIYKLWQPNYLSSVTDCVLKLLLKQVFKKISILWGNLKHIASITISCAILTMCHNFRKGTSNIWQAESDKWLRIHLGCWFFDQFKTFILSHLIDFYNIEANSFKIWLLFFPELTPIAPVKHKT